MNEYQRNNILSRTWQLDNSTFQRPDIPITRAYSASSPRLSVSSQAIGQHHPYRLFLLHTWNPDPIHTTKMPRLTALTRPALSVQQQARQIASSAVVRGSAGGEGSHHGDAGDSANTKECEWKLQGQYQEEKMSDTLLSSSPSPNLLRQSCPWISSLHIFSFLNSFVTLLPVSAFLTPVWRNTAIATALAVVIYSTFPAPPRVATSPSSDPSYTTSTAERLPVFSRVLAQITPEAKTWTERNERHLELTREAAEDRLLFQEAERPRIHRLRNPA
jgi:hypothetical protein